MPKQTKTKSKNNLFISLVSISLLLTLITIVLSAYIRLSVNGLGCDDWPNCYGKINLSIQHQGIDVLTNTGKDMPHSGARTLHRLVASALGAFVVIIAIMALRRRNIPENTGLSIPMLILTITIFLSWLGYATPTPLVPAVTLGNLLGGMTMLGLLWWLSQRTTPQTSTQQIQSDALKPAIVIGLILLCSQIGLGAWSSAFFAGPACPELTSCPGAEWSTAAINIFTPLAVDSQGKIINAGTGEIIHRIHRLGAIITAIYLLWLGFKIAACRDKLRTTAITLLVLLGLQLSTGLLSIPMQLPLLMVTAHNAIAAIMLLTMINLYHLLSPQSGVVDLHQ